MQGWCKTLPTFVHYETDTCKLCHNEISQSIKCPIKPDNSVHTVTETQQRFTHGVFRPLDNNVVLTTNQNKRVGCLPVYTSVHHHNAIAFVTFDSLLRCSAKECVALFDGEFCDTMAQHISLNRRLRRHIFCDAT